MALDTRDYSSGGGRVITLELFIIDTFTRVDEVTGVESPVDKDDQIGGGGTYAIIGARMFLPPSRLGMIIDYTPSTLPSTMVKRLKSFGDEMWVFRLRNDGHPTARAVNRYKGQLRGFEYLTDPLLLSPLSLVDTSLVNPLPSTIHFISYPSRAIQILNELDQLRDIVGVESWRPRLIWEPEPPCCIPENLEVIKSIIPQVDIISPNHTEALALLSLTPASGLTLTDMELKALLTKACCLLLSLRPRIAAIIRAGHMGCCYALSNPLMEEKETELIWIPPYWEINVEGYNNGKVVVDPTGAGNAFMGGVSAALDQGEDVHQAVLWGSVAASFTIEQDGLPFLEMVDGVERWNGALVRDRVEQLRQRCPSSVDLGEEDISSPELQCLKRVTIA